ncbi:metal ABC transporter substrate-binding protein [Carboxydothermus ferrireducens]|uniref:Zinc transport system substrate-binding protein n=1 Tax=Carboxydothermus ferrireducens DSM 11255 TaxID=1119529 RepID=A0ABX2R5T0_9THEO|nr:metal ABC transporter substrate-binding protein [Carboxydothermus ferrireducens]NYE56524.1 zinc transport system substrate-binding protein [Carboxydothermus ferrireducens DSM 11255]
MKRVLVLVLVFTLFVLSGCSNARTASTTDSGKPLIVTSIYPYGELAREIAGDKAEVTVLAPPGADAHDFEPKPSDLFTLRKADLIILNGGGLEPWAGKIIKLLGKDKVIEAEKILEGKVKKDDPHYWLSLIFARKIAEAIKDNLVTLDPGNKSYYEENYRKLADKLYELHLAMVDLTSDLKTRKIFTLHRAFGYFAADYGLQEISLMSGKEAEATIGDIEKFMKEFSAEDAEYVFFDPVFGKKVAEKVSESYRVKFMPLYTLEGVDETLKGKSYLELMQENIETLRLALGGDD